MKIFVVIKCTILERIRRFSFWAMIGLCMCTAFIVVPKANETGLQVLRIDTNIYIQAGNATWVPTAAALCMSVLFPLLAFTYVRGLIGEERKNGTMDILLTSDLSRIKYVFGKFIAGFILVCILLSTIIIGSFVMVNIRYPGEWYGIWPFLSPFLTLLPGIFFAVAISLLLESPAVFRYPSANIIALLIYFSLVVVNQGKRDTNVLTGITGFKWLHEMIDFSAIRTSGRPVQSLVAIGNIPPGNQGSLELVFNGWIITSSTILNIFMLILISLLIIILAGLFMEQRPVLITRHKKVIKENNQLSNSNKVDMIYVKSGKYQLSVMVYNELKRMKKSLAGWWCIILILLWLLSWRVNNTTCRELMLPVLLGCLMLPLSSLGEEEYTTNVYEVLCTVPGAPLRQVGASTIASVIGVLFISLPAMFHGSPEGILSSIVVFALSLFLAIMALWFGAYTKTRRAYQIVLIVFLYAALNIPGDIIPTNGHNAIIISTGYSAISLAAFLSYCVKKRGYYK